MHPGRPVIVRFARNVTHRCPAHAPAGSAYDAAARLPRWPKRPPLRSTGPAYTVEQLRPAEDCGGSENAGGWAGGVRGDVIPALRSKENDI